MSYALAIQTIGNRRGSLRFKRNEVIGAISMPGVVSDEVSSFHTDFMTTGQEIRDALFEPGTWKLREGADPQFFKWYQEVYSPFVNEWLQFYGWHKNAFWMNLPLSGSWDQVQSYRGRLIALRNSAKQFGVKYISPEPTAPKEPFGVGDVLKVAAVILGAIIVGMLAIQAIKR
jgi:hypothetical protein